MPSHSSRPLVTRRRVVAGVVFVLLAAVVAWVVRPAPVEADVVVARTGPLRVTLEEEGETRVRERYVVSAPVSGRVLRLTLEPGDAVSAGRTPLVTFRPASSSLLDERTRAEVQARVSAAQAAQRGARVEQERARAQADQTDRDLARARQLLAAGATSRQQVEAAELAQTTARQTVARAAAALRTADADLRLARAGLMRPGDDATGATIVLTSPIDGVVLRRLRESEAVVPPGEALIEVGDVTTLEVVADYLSTDAVRIRPGQPAEISRWGGGTPLAGRVRLVEPSGFTKVSALGVEEQRVNVIVDIDDPALAATRLGDRFRVEVGIVVWDAPDVLTVPVGSLVREGDGWSVFAVENGRAVRRAVGVGERNDVDARITSGLAPGARVVAFPGGGIADGVRITPSSR